MPPRKLSFRLILLSLAIGSIDSTVLICVSMVTVFVTTLEVFPQASTLCQANVCLASDKSALGCHW